MPRHIPAVSLAIQAGLNNIDILKELVKANNKTAANAVLTKYNLALVGSDLDEFWTSLTAGVMTMDAKGLVDYYERLASKEMPVKGHPPQNEWNP